MFTVVWGLSMPSWGILLDDIEVSWTCTTEKQTGKVSGDRFVDGTRAEGIQQETFLTSLDTMKQKLSMELLQMAKNRTVLSMLCT